MSDLMFPYAALIAQPVQGGVAALESVVLDERDYATDGDPVMLRPDVDGLVPHPYELLRVMWQKFAANGISEWVDRDAIIPVMPDMVVSVGYRIDELVGITVLAQSITYEGSRPVFSGVVQIPSSSIMRIERLIPASAQ